MSLADELLLLPTRAGVAWAIRCAESALVSETLNSDFELERLWRFTSAEDPATAMGRKAPWRYEPAVSAASSFVADTMEFPNTGGQKPDPRELLDALRAREVEPADLSPFRRLGSGRFAPSQIDAPEREVAEATLDDLARHRWPHARAAAAFAISALGLGGSHAVSALMAAREDAEPVVRAAVVRALSAIIPRDARTGEAIAGSMADPHERVRVAALECASQGAGASPALQRALVAWLDTHPDGLDAAFALAKQAPDHPAAIAALADALRAGERTHAISLVRELRMAHSQIIEGLQSCLDDPESMSTRWEAMLALADLGVVPRAPMAELLRDPAGERGIALMGSDAIPGLRAVIASNETPAIRDRARAHLQRLGVE